VHMCRPSVANSCFLRSAFLSPHRPSQLQTFESTAFSVTISSSHCSFTTSKPRPTEHNAFYTIHHTAGTLESLLCQLTSIKRFAMAVLSTLFSLIRAKDYRGCSNCGDGRQQYSEHPRLPHLGHEVELGEKDLSCSTTTPLYTSSPLYGGDDDFQGHGMFLRTSSRASFTPTSPLACGSLFVLGSVAALDVGDYPGGWSSAPWSPLACSGGGASCAGHTIISTIAFTAAATAIYHIKRGVPYQEYFMFAGMTLGVGIGLCTGKGLEDTIFKVLPWAILVALLCSCMLHGAVRFTQHHMSACALTASCQDCEKCGAGDLL